MLAGDGPPDTRPPVTPAIAAAVDAAKEGRLADLLGALGKALVAARKRGDLRLAEAIEQRYNATWRDVGNLRRLAVQAACRCDPTEAGALHAQLAKAGLPDRLTSAASGVTYDLHFAALSTLLSHLARFSGSGPLVGDLSAIGEALGVARKHELDQVTAALAKRYQALWQQVEALHGQAEAAAINRDAARAKAVLGQLDEATLTDQVRNTLNGTVLSFSALRASLRVSPATATPIPCDKTTPPRSEPPVSKARPQRPSPGAPPTSQQPLQAAHPHRGIWITSAALAVVLAVPILVLLTRRAGPRRATGTPPPAEPTGDAAADPSSRTTDPSGR